MRDQVRRRPRGRVRLQVFRAGVIERELDGPNLVVDAMLGVLPRMAAGDADAILAGLAVGSDGTAPDPEDAGLTGAVVVLLESVTATGQDIECAWTLETTDAVGLTIREFGLLTADGTLVARKVLNPGDEIAKTTDVRVVGTWTLTWS